MNIDVTYIADIERLIKNSLFSSTDYYNASSTGEGMIFGLTRWGNLNAGPYVPGSNNTQSNLQGGADLNIRANAGDTIRLRTNSLTIGFQHQCFIQKVECFNGTVAVTAHRCDPIPALQEASGAPLPTQGFDDYWELTVGEKNSNDQCRLKFSIFDSNSTRVGGFLTYLYVVWPGVSPYSIS